MSSSEQRKNYNRAIILILLGIFFTLWVLVNSSDKIPALIYILIGIVSMALYFFWSKIKVFVK